MTPQTNPTTCLPITDSYACLLITVQLALKQRIMVEPPWLSLCVGCWCCCCAVTKPIKRLIRALVGGLIAIGRDPTGPKAVPCGTPL